MLSESEALIKKIESYDKSKYLKEIPKAIKFIIEAHSGQKRDSGEPYVYHPIAVAHILADIGLDSLTIIAGLLHDTVEDTKVTLEKITKEFGAEVASLVDGVTKLNKIEGKSESVVQAENFRKLIIAVSKDIRVLLIKLADRMHNMRTLQHINSHARRYKVASETMDVFAPLAERIGMHWFKNELQDMAFNELQPDARASIIARLDLLKKSDPLIEKWIIGELDKLFGSNNFTCIVIGRQKSPYSIWDKMKRKNISFEQLSDIMAFRVIVDDVADCYRALGILHKDYHAVPGSIKDFISTPKKNGYQSIHTVIIGPKEHKIEIQIRTKGMHEIAEMGIAAHWCYKQDQDYIEGIKYNWIQELLQILEVASDPNELLENTKLEMYYDQVFCFTPGGTLIALPKGASTVDFAYAVHSDVGNKCVGAKVNKRVVPLRTVLQNGDQVEILTSDNHKPMPSWENFVVTGKALSEIKKSVREHNREEYMNLGRVLLSQCLEERKLKYRDRLVKSMAKFFHKNCSEDFLCAIGEGHISTNSINKYFSSKKNKDKDDSHELPKKEGVEEKKEKDSSISIKGLTPGMAVHLASCCNPIPGDVIVGLQQTGKGITVHISDCETLQHYSSNPEQWIGLSWDKNRNKEQFRACLSTIMINKPGSLSIVTAEIAKQEANIVNFKINNRSEEFFEIAIDIEVKGLTHLTNILASLRVKSCIQSVQRYLR